MAIAVVVHNVPEEFAMALPIVLSGRRRFLTRAALASAAAEPAGAVLGLAGVAAFPGLHAVFLSFAAGAMIHVSLHELWPMARGLDRHGASALGVGLGAVLIAALEGAIRP